MCSVANGRQRVFYVGDVCLFIWHDFYVYYRHVEGVRVRASVFVGVNVLTRYAQTGMNAHTLMWIYENIVYYAYYTFQFVYISVYRGVCGARICEARYHARLLVE